MKLVLLGATGAPGRHVLEQALAAGHEGRAVRVNVNAIRSAAAGARRRFVTNLKRSTKPMIDRAAVARFLLEQAADQTFHRQAPVVSGA